MSVRPHGSRSGPAATDTRRHADGGATSPTRSPPRICRRGSRRVFLDFETYSACNLKLHGAAVYAAHPSTHIILAAAAIDDGAPMDLDPWAPLPAALQDAWRDPETMTWAWKVFFEQSIAGHKWPSCWGFNLRPTRWRCSMALAAACSLPLALGNCAAWLFPDDTAKQKDKSGYRLIQQCCIPDRNGEKPELSGELRAELAEYCRQDVIAERAIHHALPLRDLTPTERSVWRLDNRINHRGFLVDRPLVSSALRMADRETLRVNRQLATLTDGAVRTAKQNAKLLAAVRAEGVSIDNMTAEAVFWALREPDLTPRGRQLLLLRQEGSFQSLRKLPPFLRASEGDGRIRGALQYHAAHTGRWAGRMVQPHNLTKPKADRSYLLPSIREADSELVRCMTGSVNRALRDCMRHVIIAKPGHTLAVCDINAIEARVAGWLANDAHYMDAYRGDLDLYRLTAAPIFNMRYEDIANPSFERDFGKKCALGLQYGMGYTTFYASCLKEGLAVTETLCRRAVRIYRDTATGVVDAWGAMELMCRKAIASPGTVFCPSQHWASLRFSAVCTDGYLRINLPSGRRILYATPSLRTLTRVDPHTGKEYSKEAIVFWRAGGRGMYQVSTHGSRLFENVTQAIARDVLAASMLHIDPVAPIVLHVHDEVVSEVPIPDAETALAHMRTWMATAPSWARGLPLKCGGFVSPFYRK